MKLDKVCQCKIRGASSADRVKGAVKTISKVNHRDNTRPINVKNPPGFEPGSLEYRSNALKVRVEVQRRLSARLLQG